MAASRPKPESHPRKPKAGIRVSTECAASLSFWIFFIILGISALSLSPIENAVPDAEESVSSRGTTIPRLFRKNRVEPVDRGLRAAS